MPTKLLLAILLGFSLQLVPMTFIIRVQDVPVTPTPNPVVGNVVDALKLQALLKTKILLMRGYTLQTGELTSSLNSGVSLDLPVTRGSDTNIRALQSNFGSQFIYFIQGPVDIKNGDLAQVVQVDLSTGKPRTILEAPNLISFMLSPDEQHAVLVSLRFDDSGKTRGATSICILAIGTGNCDSLDKPIYFFVSLHWVDSHRFIFTDRSSILYLVDVANRKLQQLPNLQDLAGIDEATPIPGSQLVLLGTYGGSATQYAPEKFYTYDLTTAQLTELSYRAGNGNPYFQIADLLVSPDGQYISYIGTCCGTRSWALRELKTGRLIAELSDAWDAKWTSDSQGVLVTTAVDTPKTFQVNATTGKVDQLAEGSVFVIVR